MCNSEACLGYVLLALIGFFTALILGLIGLRKKLLKNDLNISVNRLWSDFVATFPASSWPQRQLMFSVWQDKSMSLPALFIKNNDDKITAQVEFRLGAREYNFNLDGQAYKIALNLTWGGTHTTLYSPDGAQLAQMERKSLSPQKHVFFVENLGRIESSQPIFDFKAPITYRLDGKIVAESRFISTTRKMGRVGCFSDQLSLPVKIFFLSMTS